MTQRTITIFFKENPYDRENDLPVEYTETSSILNVDSSSDSQSETDFEGYISRHDS